MRLRKKRCRQSDQIVDRQKAPSQGMNKRKSEHIALPTVTCTNDHREPWVKQKPRDPAELAWKGRGR